MFLHAGKLRLIEVKEVNHYFRLPHKNFSPDQVARMRNWQAAGASALVLIYFEPLKLWRILDVRNFLVRTGGSWDLSGAITLTEKDAMEMITSCDL